MKNVIILSFCAFFSTFSSTYESKSSVGRHQLSMEEAEKILGEPALLSSRKDTAESNVYITKSTFAAKEAAGKANLYYIFERYNKEVDAKNSYQNIFDSNKKQKGFEQLTNYGDEAFFHTDKDNFCLIFIRKGAKILRLKVNKVTAKTSFSAFKKVGKAVIERV
jgi:hypothetical protein